MIGSKFTKRIKELELKHYLVIAVVAVIFFGTIYGIYNYRQGQIKPVELQITSPAPGVYEQDTVVVEGETKKNIYVLVNDIETRSDGEGKYYAEVALVAGENIINVTAGEGKEESKTSVTVSKHEVIVAKPVNDVAVNGVVAASGNLNNSGPETLWIPEILLLSGSALLYGSARKKLKTAIR